MATATLPGYQSVPLSELEKELEESFTRLEQDGTVIQRNITSCSVLLTHESEGPEEVNNLIQTIAESRSGRIIAARVCEGIDAIESSIALVCSSTKRDQMLCTEIISLKIPQVEISALRSLLFRHSLVGVQPVLFLLSSRISISDLREIIETFDSVVFDGRVISEDILEYLSLKKKHLADIVWILESEWRYAIASAFSQNVLLSNLKSLVRIEIAAADTSTVSDLLLAGWILYKLSLSPEAALNNGYECKFPSGQMLPLLCTHEDDLQSIAFIFDPAEIDLSVHIKLLTQGCIETCITCDGETHRSILQIGASDITSCIKRHFMQPDSHRNYKHALEKAFELYRLESGFRS